MKEKEISLSELLSTDFIIVDNKMVGTFPLDRINMISDVLKQQKEEIDNLQEENKRLNNIIKQTRSMLYKRDLDSYDTYTANVILDIQSDFEEILRGEEI